MNVKKTEWNENCVYIFVKPPSLEELVRSAFCTLFSIFSLHVPFSTFTITLK